MSDNTEDLEKPAVGTKVPSSTGGTIVYTKTGLIHYAGRPKGVADEEDDE